MYAGVPGNLVAFACKLSFQRGHEGNVSFLSKSQLIEHYEKTLGAFQLHEYFTKQKADSKKLKSKGSIKKAKQPKVIV